MLEAASDAVEDDWEPAQDSHFEASRGYSASLGTSNGTAELAVKGAPEVVLPLCTSVVDGDGAEPRSLDEAGRRTTEETVRRLADEGLRLLAVAERRSGLPDEADDLEPLVQELSLIGFVGISDSLATEPPTPSARWPRPGSGP